MIRVLSQGMDREPGMNPERREVTCDDCFFKRAELCALPGNRLCPTFRPAPVCERPLRRVSVAVASERRVGAAA